MTRALVISGGGDKGAFAVGAVEVLLESGWSPDLISGTSTGALIAPMVAIGDIEELVKLYTTVRKKDIIRYNWRRFFRDAIYDTKPLERLIRKTLFRERYERLQMSRVQVLLCVVSFQTGAVVYFSQRDTVVGVGWQDFDGLVKAILASTNQPVLMPPVFIGGQTFFDGGIKEVAPLRAAIQSGADDIVVVANSPQASLHPDTYDRIIEIGPRAIDLLTEEVLNNDVKARGGDCKITLIRPKGLLPSSGLDFEPAVMQRMREEGRERAFEVLQHG